MPASRPDSNAANGGPNPTVTGERYQRQAVITGAVGNVVVLGVDVCERLSRFFDHALHELARANAGNATFVAPEILDALSLLRAGASMARAGDPGLTAVAVPGRLQRKSAAEVAELPVQRRSAHGSHLALRVVAQRWGVTPRWLRDLAESGDLPATRDESGHWVMAADFVYAYTTVAAARAAHQQTRHAA